MTIATQPMEAGEAGAVPSPALGLQARSLAGLPLVRHSFFGRRGGRSIGPYDALNVGTRSQDDPAAVAANRVLVATELGMAPGALLTARQVHGTRCLKVTEAWPDEMPPEADALVTDRQGILLGALTADCAPILFADAQAGIVGAAHAGWRGALSGIIEATLAGMRELGADTSRVIAAVGPCIGQTSYEVGFEFEEAFVAQDAASARFFTPAQPGGRPHFDLPGYCGWRLERAGVAWVELSGRDTCAEHAMFFSHRRASKTSDPRHGLQVGAIGLVA